MASIERGTPSGSEWACMSIAPAKVCANEGVAIKGTKASTQVGFIAIAY
jgi:hypothetical protein